MFHIAIQIIGLIAFIISLVAYHKDKKEKILLYMILSSLLNLIHYLLLGAYSGCVTKLISVIRDSFIILKQKYKNSILSSNIFLIVFLIIYLITTILTYNGIWSILPVIASSIYIVCIWNGNPLTIKEAAFFCYFLWLSYNIFVFSIAGIISNIVSIISTLIAIKNVK